MAQLPIGKISPLKLMMKRRSDWATAIGETEVTLMCEAGSLRFRSVFIALALSIFSWSTIPNQAAALSKTAQITSELCFSAAQIAAKKTGVPLPVLIAISLTETGRTTESGLKPWPWAINQAGEGYWFDTPEDAIQFAEDQLDLGLRNFDVGCFQLNHRWHSQGFISTRDMFDPVSNAIYAAQFLADLYFEKGDWSLAAAAYHSRTPDQADRYKAKYEDILAGLADAVPITGNQPIPPIRSNRFPLLQAGLKGNFGSIMPRISTGGPLIGNYP